MVINVISCFLIILGAYFKGKMDTVMFRGRNSGWSNKWELGPTGKLLRYNGKDWYYFGHYPLFKEKFPYSSTLFVCLTDNWHRYQFLFLRCIYLAIAIQMAGFFLALILTFVIFPLLYGIGFYITFERISRRI